MSQRIAIVTGAGSGIGRAVAIELAKQGYCQTLAGRRIDALAETARLCGAEAQVHCVSADVTNENDVVRLFSETVSEYGRLDLLFNNAGLSGPAVKLEDVTLIAWRNVLATNVDGAFLCLREAFRVMKTQRPQGGRIINNGSISATSPRPSSAPYTASKHAITGLTKSASLDGRAYNIACGQIDIGNASSAMGATMAQGVPQADGRIAAEPVFDVSLVGPAVAYMDSLPLDVNVQFMTLMATQMPFVGRG